MARSLMCEKIVPILHGLDLTSQPYFITFMVMINDSLHTLQFLLLLPQSSAPKEARFEESTFIKLRGIFIFGLFRYQSHCLTSKNEYGVSQVISSHRKNGAMSDRLTTSTRNLNNNGVPEANMYGETELYS